MEGAARPSGAATVAGLFVYPMKSCRGVSLACARVAPQGLALAEGPLVPVDRQWCVCGDDGLVQDQRIQPKLALLHVAITAPGAAGAAGRLVLSVEGSPELGELALPVEESAYTDGERVMVSDRYKNLWFGRALSGYCAGQEAADWITRFIRLHSKMKTDERFRIVRFASGEQGRHLSESFRGKSPIAQRARPGDTAGFADCAPVHLLSEESLADLSGRLPADSRVEQPVSFRRFRPNILLRGAAAPYAEDGLWEFAVGAATFRQLGPTGRCVIPTTNPETGVRDEEEQPRATLLEYRPLPYGAGPHGGPTLGIWAAPDACGEVAVGDAVRPLGPEARL